MAIDNLATLLWGPPNNNSGNSGGGYYGIIGEPQPPAPYYQGGNPWTTGYEGGRMGVGVPVGGSANPGPSGADAWRWAFEQSQNAAEQGLGRLQGGQFLGGRLGQSAQQGFMNPQGFDPAALEAMKAELAQMHAGSRENALRNMAAQANASGFGDSMGAIRAASDIRNRSTQGLTSDIRALMMEAERAKMQEKGISASLAGQLAALEAAMNEAYARGQLGRQFPAIPGIGEEGSGNAGGSRYQWIDPETGRVNKTPPGGWTAETFRQMQEERVRWENQNG